MDRIGISCKLSIFAVFCLSATSVASYQPVTGSTITVVPVQGVAFPVHDAQGIQLASSTLTVIQSSNGVNASTIGVVQIGPGFFNVEASTWGTPANPFTVKVPTAIQLASTTLNVNMPTAIQLASTTLTVNVPLAIQLASGTSGSPFYVQFSSWNTNGSTVAASQQGSWAVSLIGPGVQLASATLNVQPVGQGIQLASSTIYMYMVNYGTSPIQIVGVTGSTTTIGYQTNGSSMPVNVLNNVNVTCTSGCSGSSSGGTWTAFGVAMSSGVPAFFVNPSGNGQMARVDASSNLYVNAPLGIQLASPTINVQVIGQGIQLASTTLVVIQSSNGVNASTINVVQVGPNFAVDLSTLGVVSNKLFVTVPLAVQLASSTIGVQTSGPFTVNQGSQSATASWRVDLSTLATTANPANVFMLNYGTAPVQIVGVTGSTVTVGYQTNGSSIPVNGGFANNGVAAATDRVTTLPAVAQNQPGSNGSAYTQGRNAAVNVLTKSGAIPVWIAPDITYPSFSASTGTIPPASNATWIAALCGNASNTVYLGDIRVSCTQTTAGIIPMAIQFSTLSFVGSFSTITARPQDTNYAGAVSSATWFQINPTNVGPPYNLDTYRLGCMATGTATPNDIYISPAYWRSKPIVLRGATQCVAVNLLGTTVTGGNVDVTFDWMEVTSP